MAANTNMHSINTTGPNAASAIAITPSRKHMIRCWRPARASYAAIAIANMARTIPNASRPPTIFTTRSLKWIRREQDLLRSRKNSLPEGLDVEPISNELTELTDTLKKSRTYVHSFSRNTFQQVAAPGEQAVRANGRSRQEGARRIQISPDRSGCEHRLDWNSDARRFI